MSEIWTPEQILAQAPDDSSRKAGQGLATARKWATLGRSPRALWGECQGSGSSPYQTQVDLNGPAFKCSCPSRKFPCKHGIGLALLFAAQAGAFPDAEPPAWVAQWLEGRDSRAEKKPATAPAEKTPDPEAQAKRAAQREDRVGAGLQELELWMRDLARQGLASVQGRPYGFWETPAARMVDAQAGGIARAIREMAGIPATGGDWPERLLERLGRLHLLVEAYRRRESLPEPLQAEIRSQIGWTLKEEEVLAGPSVRDRWQVVGQRVEEEERLRTQRTWLLGSRSGQPALILRFAHGGAPLPADLLPGSVQEAELAFYPSSYPLRAALKEQGGPPEPLPALGGFPDIEAALGGYADALAGNPWLELFPMALQSVTPFRDGEAWGVADPEGRVLPISSRFVQGWRLLAVSGGRPVALFGEWNGRALLPLSAIADGRFVPLAAEPEARR